MCWKIIDLSWWPKKLSVTWPSYRPVSAAPDHSHEVGDEGGGDEDEDDEEEEDDDEEAYAMQQEIQNMVQVTMDVQDSD